MDALKAEVASLQRVLNAITEVLQPPQVRGSQQWMRAGRVGAADPGGDP